MADISSYEHGQEAGFGDYVALLKPRVMSLVVFTAMVGLLVAPVAVHPFVAFTAILFIALGGGASGALNMWYDADIDAIMRRTRARPVPSGRVTAGEALGLGLGLSGLSVMMLSLAGNIFAGLMLAFTIFFYAVVYTIWLKRRTPQNIVIGGAAGAFPPMIGWAVATGGISLSSLAMFAIVFLWTPPHFWSLALYRTKEYAAAGLPMLPVTHGAEYTRRHVFFYTIGLT
ncbi:MAG: heme o synthase, partial [Phaeovulum sp.]|uniref:heme o synthase n=1 Tax=Phaeovulum sp. TaxID=2934796 RepID=UPI002732F02E